LIRYQTSRMLQIPFILKVRGVRAEQARSKLPARLSRGSLITERLGVGC
jgi:hypothetical protein